MRGGSRRLSSGSLLLGLTGLTALCMLLAPWVLAPFGLPADYDDLAVTLSRILFPIVVLLGVSGVVVGILNSYEQFSIPALTPVFWNLAIIIGLVVGVPQADSESAKLYVYAGSILVGTIIQVLLPVPWLLELDGRLHRLIDWRDPAVKQVFVLMIPVTLGLGLINFNAVIGTFFASRYIDPTISPSAIDAAFRIYMLPQGMFSVAVATVLFPAISRLAARGDMDGVPLHRVPSASVRSRSCSCRRASPPPCSPSRSCGCCTSAASSRPTRRRSSPRRSRRSRPGSRSTG